MTPKVNIGSNYRPQSFERRTSNCYQALRPQMSYDAELLQRALLSVRPTLRERVLRVLRPF